MIELIRAEEAFQSEVKQMGCDFSEDPYIEHYVAIKDGQVIGFFKGQTDSEGCYWVKDKEMFLEYFKAIEMRKGYGQLMLQAIFEYLPVEIIQAETSIDNKLFWETMGACVNYDSFDDIREMYVFTLRKQDFTNKQRQ